MIELAPLNRGLNIFAYRLTENIEADPAMIARPEAESAQPIVEIKPPEMRELLTWLEDQAELARDLGTWSALYLSLN